MRGAETEAGDLNRAQSVLGHRTAKPIRHFTADRQERNDRLVLQADERVANGRTGRRVQPLEVVDRQAERPIAR